MLLPADSVSVHPGPGGTPALVASIGAIVALLIACAMQARALASLRAKLEESSSTDRAQSAVPTHQTGRRPGVRFGGLYEERADPLQPLRGLPGGPGLAIAALCAVAALVLAAVSRGPTPPPNPVSREEVIALRAALDSVSRRLGELGDSVRLTRLSAAPSVRPPNPARIATAKRPKPSPAPVIPPGPALVPSVPVVQTTP